MFDTICQEFRYAARSLRRSRIFAATAVLTLAIVVGLNTAVFSIVDAVLLRPLTYPHPDQLVVIHDTVPHLGDVPVSAGEFEEWTRSAHAFDSMALLAFVPANLTGTGEPERVDAARVSPTLFSLLRVTPAAGRLFVQGDDVAGRDRVVVLSNDLWRRRFGADPSVVGRTIRVNDVPFTVVGVLPRDFRFPRLDNLLAMPIASGRPEVWLPFRIRPEERTENSFACVARLKPGASAPQARTELNAIEHTIGRRFTPPLDLAADVVPLQQQLTKDVRTNLDLLWAGVILVLLIATANVANLLLARISTRRRELAVRAAVGASRGRIMRQLIVEGLVLTSAGGVLGVALAYMALPAIIAISPGNVPRLDEVAIDIRVLAFATAIIAASGIAIGVIGGVRAAGAALAAAVRSHASALAETARDRGVRRLLAASQIALAVVSVAAAGLLIRSLINILSVDRGFAVQHVVSVDVTAAGPRYASRETRAALTRSALGRLRATPGVSSVGVVNKLPLNGVSVNSVVVAAGTEGTGISLQQRPLGDIRTVNTDYFRTLRIPLVRGRLFDDRDHDRNVAVMSVAAAERTWPGQNPIGKRFRLTADPQRTIEVVGVVGDVLAMGLDAKAPYSVYLPYWQGFLNNISFVIGSPADPRAIEPTVRGALRAIDPELAVAAIRPMADIVSDSVASRRFEAGVLASLALAALLLASIGVYGVLAFAVEQRTREIGVRLAVGASPSQIRSMTLHDALRVVVPGLAVGVPAAAAAGFVLRALLFQVGPQDPVTLTIAATTLSLVAIVAARLPARRAAAVNPVVSLRME